MKKIGIVMGSDSDLPIVRKATSILDSFEAPYEVHVYSAHRTHRRCGYGGSSGRCPCRKHHPPRDRYSRRIGSPERDGRSVVYGADAYRYPRCNRCRERRRKCGAAGASDPGGVRRRSCGKAGRKAGKRRGRSSCQERCRGSGIQSLIGRIPIVYRKEGIYGWLFRRSL